MVPWNYQNYQTSSYGHSKGSESCPYLASGMVKKAPTGHLLPAPPANYQIFETSSKFIMLYLIWQNFGEQKCQKFGFVPKILSTEKILSAEKFCPPKDFDRRKFWPPKYSISTEKRITTRLRPNFMLISKICTFAYLSCKFFELLLSYFLSYGHFKAEKGLFRGKGAFSMFEWP